MRISSGSYLSRFQSSVQKACLGVILHPVVIQWLKENRDDKSDCCRKFRLIETAVGDPCGWAACVNCLSCLLFTVQFEDGTVKLIFMAHKISQITRKRVPLSGGAT